LAFNLAHLYFDAKLGGVTAYLKGEDAHVYISIVSGVGTRTVLADDKFEVSALDGKRPGLGVMTWVIIKRPFYYPVEESSYEIDLVEEQGGIPPSNNIRATHSDHWDGVVDDSKRPQRGRTDSPSPG